MYGNNLKEGKTSSSSNRHCYNKCFLFISEIIGAKEEQSSATAWWCQSTKREHRQTKVTSNNISQTLSRWSWIRGFWHLHKHQAEAHYGSQRHWRSSHSLRGTNIGYRSCVIIENRQVLVDFSYTFCYVTLTLSWIFP